MTRLLHLLFLPLACLIILDAMVTTPLALAFIPDVIEANPFGALGYAHYGLIFFYIAGTVEIALLYLACEGLDALGQRLNQANVIQQGEKGRYNWFYRYGPLLAFALPGICIIGWTVIHNTGVILRGFT